MTQYTVAEALAIATFINPMAQPHVAGTFAWLDVCETEFRRLGSPITRYVYRQHATYLPLVVKESPL